MKVLPPSINKGKEGGGGWFSSNSTSSSKIEQKWKEGFRDQVFFFQGKTDSFGVLTAYFGKETLLKNVYIYSAYADDTTFSLKNVISIKHMVDTFFLYLSGLKQIFENLQWIPERGSSGSLWYASIDLNNAMLKILSTHFCYNKKTERGKIN